MKIHYAIVGARGIREAEITMSGWNSHPDQRFRLFFVLPDGRYGEFDVTPAVVDFILKMPALTTVKLDSGCCIRKGGPSDPVMESIAVMFSPVDLMVHLEEKGVLREFDHGPVI